MSNYNILVIGYTGVGKSRLINYFLGKKSAPSGSGRPLTQEITPYPNNDKNFPVVLYDTKGFEIGDGNTLTKAIEEKLTEHSLKKPAKDWFHSILYCIDGVGSRIQDHDYNIIEKLVNVYNYRVIVVVTKADLIPKKLLDKRTDEIGKLINGKITVMPPIPIIAVGSGYDEIEDEELPEPFGKKELKKQILNNFYDSIALRLPLRCKDIITEYIKEWENTQIREINSSKDKISFEKIQNKLEDSCNILNEEIPKIIRDETSETIEIYLEITKNIDKNMKESLEFDDSSLKKIKPSSYFKDVGTVVKAIGALGSLASVVSGATGAIGAAGTTGAIGADGATGAIGAGGTTAIVALVYSYLGIGGTATGVAAGGTVAGGGLLAIGMTFLPFLTPLPFVLVPGFIMLKKRSDKNKAITSLINEVNDGTSQIIKDVDTILKSFKNSLEESFEILKKKEE